MTQGRRLAAPPGALPAIAVVNLTVLPLSVRVKTRERREFVQHNLRALLEGDYLESFELDRCCDELDTVVDLAHGLSVPVDCPRLFEARITAR